MSDELLDYVDENDNILGQILRSEIDKKGFWGRIAGVLVFNSKGEVLLCKEADHKASGGKWKFSAIGHITSGDTAELAAVREAKEEVGIDIKIDDLEKLISFKHVRKDGKGKRIMHIFKVVYDGAFVIDKAEFSECKFVSPKQIDEEMTSQPEMFSGGFITFWKNYRK
ncbi:MAG: NUDIX hydrolase [Alphaproteobacteria bacterium]|nr:NUDIX hydrolase [Alphaproteobacteria bacterium]